MQTHTGSAPLWLALLLMVLALSACTTQVTQASLDAPMNVSGSWRDTDVRAAAEAMVKEALKQPWSRRFTQMMGRAPMISVGTVVNRTREELNTQTLVKDLERALASSEQVRFVAGAGQRPETPTRADTVKPAEQEGGADFMLRGVVNPVVGERDSAQAGFYQVELELVDLASDVQIWQGQRKIKKLVEGSKTTL